MLFGIVIAVIGVMVAAVIGRSLAGASRGQQRAGAWDGSSDTSWMFMGSGSSSSGDSGSGSSDCNDSGSGDAGCDGGGSDGGGGDGGGGGD